MSDKPIQVGDLVMVVRSCCGYGLGKIFQVAEIDWNPFQCAGTFGCCGKITYGVQNAKIPGVVAAPIPWLKRLDPDALKDDVPTKEEIHA